MKHVLAVTGGVGAGKSTVLELLRQHCGARVIMADRVAEELQQPGGAAFEGLKQILGEDILREDRTLNRELMAHRIFADSEKRRAVNDLVHPLTVAEMKRRVRESEAELVVCEAALPEQARFREYCDAVLYVTVSPEIRIARLEKSRGYSREKALSIMARQLSEEQFRSCCDAVLVNDGTPGETAAALKEVLQKLFGEALPWV